MAKIVLLALLGLGILIPSAHAVEWKINATQSETLEANDNRLLQPKPKGNSYNSISSVFLNARALTPTSTFTFLGSLDYHTFGGPGEETQLNTLNNSVDARFEKTERTTVYNARASRVERDTSTLQLLETGQATATGTTVITTASGGFKHQYGLLDTLSSQTTWTQTDTSGSTPIGGGIIGGTHNSFNSVTSTLDLNHRINSITNWLPSLQFQQLNYDDAAHTQVQFWRATNGLDADVTKLLHVKASVGATMLEGSRGIVPGVSPLAGVTSGSASATDWIADITMAYRYAYGVVSFTAARTNGPTTLGQFTKTQTVGMSVSYRINDVSSLAFGTSFSHLITTTSPSDQISASVSYSRTILHDLQAQLTYRYQHRMSDLPVTAVTAATTTGTEAQSNAILFVLRRDVVLVP